MMAAQGDTLRLSQREWQINAGSRFIRTADTDVRPSTDFDAKARAAQHGLCAGSVGNPPVGRIAGKAMLDELHARCAGFVEQGSLVERIIFRHIRDACTAAL